jgi:peptidyl-prolyl cis-trans isomerase SurA
MMLKTPINQISPVFESQFGWHILQVLGEREQDMSEAIQTQLSTSSAICTSV